MPKRVLEHGSINGCMVLFKGKKFKNIICLGAVQLWAGQVGYLGPSRMDAATCAFAAQTFAWMVGLAAVKEFMSPFLSFRLELPCAAGAFASHVTGLVFCPMVDEVEAGASCSAPSALVW